MTKNGVTLSNGTNGSWKKIVYFGPGFYDETYMTDDDWSQTIMNGYFTMMMVVDVSDEADFSALSTELKELGKKLGVEINIRNEKMYAAMHEMSGGLE